MLKILLVDDEPRVLAPFADLLRSQGYMVRTAKDGATALSAVRDEVFDVIVSDVRMPEVGGLEVFRAARAEAPATRVILMTGYATVPDAVAAMQEGAIDYLSKPFDPKALLKRFAGLAEEIKAQRAMDDARAASRRERSETIELVAESPLMRQMLSRAALFSSNKSPVLINGERGTGKEFLARWMHSHSPRAHSPFVAVRCVGFTQPVFEAELFGHRSGTLPRAPHERLARLLEADGGTLYLDEISELSLGTQARLVRLIREGTFEPLGSSKPQKVDVRIVAGSQIHLVDRVASRHFRQDLYEALREFQLFVPPLRERGGDIVLLVDHFLRRLSPTPRPATASPRVLAALSGHAFPGNVRELRHALEYAIALSNGGEIDVDHLPTELSGPPEPQVSDRTPSRTLSQVLRTFEREYLKRVMAQVNGHKREAAKVLGISRKTLWSKLRVYGLWAPDAPRVSRNVKPPKGKRGRRRS